MNTTFKFYIYNFTFSLVFVLNLLLLCSCVWWVDSSSKTYLKKYNLLIMSDL